ncbi:hypothetical protein PACTADRAFT_48629 [Pachysolen tannophilus NRRL Y-2460]|uniref:Uncharacterized protein n=1 Tax=Pachysolen tannophilus NRRL Y-2460 TaxID=669874 RepID=A0A1E4TYJ6_PACTA|nr:hypothetical protein PACTADRAFT_48629 [Pachysolen tannophilus NRRL Y-2460]
MESRKIKDINVKELFEKIEKNNYKLDEISPIEALSLFNLQIANLLKLEELMEIDDRSINFFRLLFKDNGSTGVFKDDDDDNSLNSCDLTINNLQNIAHQDDLQLPLRRNSKLQTNFEELDINDSLEGGSESHRDAQLAPDVPSMSSLHSVPSVVLCDQEMELQLERKHRLRSGLIKKFYLKEIPSLSIVAYLERIFKYGELSTGVILTASIFLFSVIFNINYKLDYHRESTININSPAKIRPLPVNKFNIFRIVLTVIRVALKLIEDKNFKQSYYCKITGLESNSDLFKLELNLLFLTDFNLFINELVIVEGLKMIRILDNNIQKL